MSDGPTGIQVAPVTEDEAMASANMFQRAAQAIIGMPALQKQVAELSNAHFNLQRDFEAKVSHATMLDDQLRDMRTQRNEAEAKAIQRQAEIDRLSRMVDALQRDLGHLNAVHGEAVSALRQSRSDHDNAELRAMELEDEVKTWKSRAEQGRAKLNDMLSLFKADEPKAPEPIPQSAPEPVVTEAVYTQGNLSPPVSSSGAEPSQRAPEPTTTGLNQAPEPIPAEPKPIEPPDNTYHDPSRPW